MSYWRMRRIISPMAGCVSEPEGYGLMETPGEANVQGLPRRSTIAAGSKPPPAAWKNPNWASRMLGAAVQPRAARSAATTPASAACPAWNGLVMEPKFSRRPPASAAAMPRACAVFVGVQPAQFCAGGGAAEGADGSGGVEAVVVVPGRDGLGDLAFDFDAHVIGREQVLPGAASRFAERERRRKHGDGGMREQSVDAIFGDGELRVVVIVGVDEDAVGEGGEARRRLSARSR